MAALGGALLDLDHARSAGQRPAASSCPSPLTRATNSVARPVHNVHTSWWRGRDCARIRPPREELAPSGLWAPVICSPRQPTRISAIGPLTHAISWPLVEIREFIHHTAVYYATDGVAGGGGDFARASASC